MDPMVLRRIRGATVAGVLVAAALSGCARPGQQDADRVATWIGSQDQVVSARASATTETMSSPGVEFEIAVDPAVSDDDLRDLAAASERRAQEAGWPRPRLIWHVGEGRSFSNGDRAAFEVFTRLRDDPRWLELSARGDGDCGAFYCVRIAETDPASLQRAVVELLALAEDAGGVQQNLEFDAVSADGDFRVSAQPAAGSEASVALWQRVAADVPLVSAWAWVVSSAEGHPATLLLDLEVPDDTARAAAERIAATEPGVQTTVTVSGSPARG
ncbi:hypothetical protein ACEXQB_005080 [Herbiconiux sp. P18]|uniref:hypothetical protein n=1 Tax=Herbiconiux liangxiaofengii TaxID=3342795 RepID=UPI0035B97858